MIKEFYRKKNNLIPNKIVFWWRKKRLWCGKIGHKLHFHRFGRVRTQSEWELHNRMASQKVGSGPTLREALLRDTIAGPSRQQSCGKTSPNWPLSPVARECMRLSPGQLRWTRSPSCAAIISRSFPPIGIHTRSIKCGPFKCVFFFFFNLNFC